MAALGPVKQLESRNKFAARFGRVKAGLDLMSMFMRGMIFPGGREPVLRGEGVFLRYPMMSDHAAWASLRKESREFLAPWEPSWAPDELSRRRFADASAVTSVRSGATPPIRFLSSAPTTRH